ncbi:SPOR domain-containing protein [Phenylobacterium sp.]|uniref:cell division protein FtsN n=1 Tax=Phenylobacterium sp. TaxID=1871053 RepID=UPI002C3EB03F|nr:SPOR domain-containing protein [Phenylobacterium sp.]HVI33148.1 SPOR domain-containing protein [Phenylobacterium sp.]
MSDHERGAYTPPTTDAPLSFDARQPVRGARPIPFTLIISALVLVALVVAIVIFYRSGVREAGQPPQTVGAPVAEMKAAPPAEAQPQDPAAGLQIYRSEAGQPPEAVPPQFTPPPEQPQPRPAPAPVVVAPPAAAPTQPVASGPALRPALPAAQAPAPKAAPPAQVAAAPPPPAPKAAPTFAPAPAAKATGGAAVQIGAVSSTALADKAWNDAVAAAPGLAAGKGKSVERIERDGSVLYRTAVTGFADRAQATAFCNRLKAAGKSCFVR